MTALTFLEDAESTRGARAAGETGRYLSARRIGHGPIRAHLGHLHGVRSRCGHRNVGNRIRHHHLNDGLGCCWTESRFRRPGRQFGKVSRHVRPTPGVPRRTHRFNDLRRPLCSVVVSRLTYRLPHDQCHLRISHWASRYRDHRRAVHRTSQSQGRRLVEHGFRRWTRARHHHRWSHSRATELALDLYWPSPNDGRRSGCRYLCPS